MLKKQYFRAEMKEGTSIEGHLKRVKAWQGLTSHRLCMQYAPPRRRLVASAKPMRTVDKVLNQRVDWVAWASIEPMVHVMQSMTRAQPYIQ